MIQTEKIQLYMHGGRISHEKKRDLRLNGFFAYDVRSNGGNNYTYEENVLVNHCGVVVLDKELVFPKETYWGITEEQVFEKYLVKEFDKETLHKILAIVDGLDVKGE